MRGFGREKKSILSPDWGGQTIDRGERATFIGEANPW
jgi:hypothetical protein